MEITRLPDEIEPNKIMEKQIRKKHSVCPLCGENRKYDPKEEIKYLRVGSADGIYGIQLTDIKKRYGKQKPLWKHLFQKSCIWKKIVFICNTCGAEWESEEFPEIDVKRIVIKR